MWHLTCRDLAMMMKQSIAWHRRTVLEGFIGQ
jgi:hypothetical protein